MIIPIKHILLEVESYDPNYLLNLIGQINSFKPFINCAEELDRGNRVKRDMIGLITGTQQAINQGKEEWYGSYNDPNNPSLINESTGPSQEWKDTNVKKIVSPIQTRHNITVYGEHHFKPDEVHSIRAQIIQNKPDIIIHEIPEDYEHFKKHLPNTRFYHLERGLDKNIYKYFPNNLAEQFKHRETNMIRNIDYAGFSGLNDTGPKNINVVVGDTHLRTIDTPELGKKSPFHGRGFNIVRSKYKEIE